jgi:putative flavoprotein involved in K+ transport
MTLPQVDGASWPVVVIGGGQAGLSVSYHLLDQGLEHVVLEARQAGGDWLERRWDSFCLVTPNWQCRLPGFGYAGDDPDGFMVRDEIVRYLRDYVKSFDFPLVEGVAATRLRQDRDGTFRIGTSAGELTAAQVVVATGPYQVPRTPRLAERMPVDIIGVHSAQYRNPGQLPGCEVLVAAGLRAALAAPGTLRAAGQALAARYTWTAAANAHVELYRRVLRSGSTRTPERRTRPEELAGPDRAGRPAA